MTAATPIRPDVTPVSPVGKRRDAYSIIETEIMEINSIFQTLERWSEISAGGGEDVKQAFDTTVEQLAKRGQELVDEIEEALDGEEVEEAETDEAEEAQS